MSVSILGLMTNKLSQDKYSINNEMSEHLLVNRANRVKLVDWDSKPLYYFEVFKHKSNSRQIHLLLEDATLVVFNRDTYKIITVILLTPSRMKFYMNYIEEHNLTNENEIKLNSCSKLNKINYVNRVDDGGSFAKDRLQSYMKRKRKIIEKGELK